MKRKIAVVVSILMLCMTFAAAATTAFATPLIVYDVTATTTEGEVYISYSDEESEVPAIVEATRVLTEARKCEWQTDGIIKDEFYLGLKDSDGNPITGQMTVSIETVDAETVAEVRYWDEEKNVWLSIPFKLVREENEIVLTDVEVGAYRFIVRLGGGSSETTETVPPSVQQEGVQVTSSDMGKARVVFVYESDAATYLSAEAIATIEAAMRSAMESGTTAESMGLEEDKVITTQFYLGVHDEDGNLIDTTIDEVSFAVANAEEAEAICGVYYWNGATWTSVEFSADFTESDKSIWVENALVGVYRFVSSF